MSIEQLGERIREARSRLGLTQNDLASSLQVSAQAVSKWERGENAPDIAIIPQLARLLGVSADRLLGITAIARDTVEATVMFTDMIGFVRRVRDLPAADVAMLVNSHFYETTEVILRYDGVPMKYIGDAFLCVFVGPGHERRGVQAALHAARLTSEEMAVGLNSGAVYMGRVGHPDYARLDVMGQVVNGAALAEQAAVKAESRIVANAATVDAARSGEDAPEFESVPLPPRTDDERMKDLSLCEILPAKARDS